MKKEIKFFFAFWAILLLLMVVHKPMFMIVQHDYAWSDLAMLPTIIYNGLSMDLSMSAYLLAPVALWLIAAVWVRSPRMISALKIYAAIAAIIIASVYVADSALYPYWKIHLDATPVFYITTAPAAAFASVAWWVVIAGFLITAILATLIYMLFAWLIKRIFGDFSATKIDKRTAATAVMTILAALLIIPIRGGVTVSTMAPGRAYFGTDMHLNQAAVNPIFNFMHSLAHVDNLKSQFHFYDNITANKYLASLEKDAPVDSVAEDIHLRAERPDIYLIILESFSAHLMPSLGGEPIAPCLDSIANEGVLFTDFYAESFRTDRGLATILGGSPAMPTTSVFRYQNKFGNLPSLASQLADEGYNTTYYYGGDINFTNMNAYLVATGFKTIIKDTDFAVNKRLSKWGVHDEVLFERALADKTHSPEFRVIQTSSSHEPYEVPYHKLENIRANAFAYADSCLGHYIRTLKASPSWQNALVVIVPDHWGSYPENPATPLERQHIPLVLTGGALVGAPARIANTGSQSAIAPTLLTLLGIEPHRFVNPRNLLDSSRQGYAWMAVPEWYGIKQGNNFTQIIVNTQQPATSDTTLLHQSKAFVQHIYNDLDKR